MERFLPYLGTELYNRPRDETKAIWKASYLLFPKQAFRNIGQSFVIKFKVIFYVKDFAIKQERTQFE